MKLFKAFVLTSAILSCVGLANAGEVGVGGSDLFKFIDDTPEVISASNRTRVAQAGIKIAQAADAPNVSLNTLGSMWRHDSSNAPVGRGGVGETRYLDAQVVVSAPLYDFGVVEYSVDAAEARARAGGLRELQVKNNIAAEALSSLLEHQTASLKKQMYTKFLADVATLIELEEERYIAGFSTLSKVRELKLQYLDISTAADETVELSNRTRKLLERRFKGFDYERVPTVRLIEYVQSALSSDEDSLLAIERQIYADERLGITHQVASVESSRLPKIEFKGSSRFYDVDKGSLDKYSLEAGIQLSVNLFDGGQKTFQIDELETEGMLLDARFNERFRAAIEENERLKSQLTVLTGDLKDLSEQAEILSDRSIMVERQRALGSSSVEEQIEVLTSLYGNRFALLEAQLAYSQTVIEIARLREQLYPLLINFE